MPNILRLINIKQNDQILDVACGNGFFTREFFKKGGKVKGIDISPELIEIAKKNSPKEIEYFVLPADNLEVIKDKSIDKIVMILVMQNIENVGGVFNECNRVLKNGGKIFLVMNHPSFRIPKKSSWGFDEKTKFNTEERMSICPSQKLKLKCIPAKSEAKTPSHFIARFKFILKC